MSGKSLWWTGLGSIKVGIMSNASSVTSLQYPNQQQQKTSKKAPKMLVPQLIKAAIKISLFGCFLAHIWNMVSRITWSHKQRP